MRIGLSCATREKTIIGTTIAIINLVAQSTTVYHRGILHHLLMLNHLLAISAPPTSVNARNRLFQVVQHFFRPSTRPIPQRQFSISTKDTKTRLMLHIIRNSSLHLLMQICPIQTSNHMSIQTVYTAY